MPEILRCQQGGQRDRKYRREGKCQALHAIAMLEMNDPAVGSREDALGPPSTGHGPRTLPDVPQPEPFQHARAAEIEDEDAYASPDRGEQHRPHIVVPKARGHDGGAEELHNAGGHHRDRVKGFHGYILFPYARSPASPRPGTMYASTVISSSIAPSQNLVFAGKCFRANSTPSVLAITDTTWIALGLPIRSMALYTSTIL